MESIVKDLVLASTTVDPTDLDDTTDLWDAGMSSVQSVNLMLAVEDHFGLEFPEQHLTRARFTSVESIVAGVKAVLAGSAVVR